MRCVSFVTKTHAEGLPIITKCSSQREDTLLDFLEWMKKIKNKWQAWPTDNVMYVIYQSYISQDVIYQFCQKIPADLI